MVFHLNILPTAVLCYELKPGVDGLWCRWMEFFDVVLKLCSKPRELTEAKKRIFL